MVPTGGFHLVLRLDDARIRIAGARPTEWHALAAGESPHHIRMVNFLQRNDRGRLEPAHDQGDFTPGAVPAAG
jgi:hypothetical protein